MKRILAEINLLEKLAAQIGPHGGKIVGHTKSGKPIYESHSGEHAHEMHPHFTVQDHEEARKFHAGKAGEQVHPMRMKTPGAAEEYKRQNDMAANHVNAKYIKFLDKQKSQK